uniref:Uncharacterized protein n=1 Tax=Arundo donax TaxID=35708 RepID=A0A0A9GZ95_ARUDO
MSISKQLGCEHDQLTSLLLHRSQRSLCCRPRDVPAQTQGLLASHALLRASG